MDSIVIRFPDGTREFRYPGRALQEGEVVTHGGGRYRVVAVGEGEPPIVTVEPESDSIADMLASEEGALSLELVV